jgi:hypothetical protein
MYRSTYSWPSVLVGGEWSASRPDHFTHGEKAPVPIGVVPRVGLHDVEDCA